MSPVLQTYVTSKDGMIVLPPVESIPLNVTAIGNENTLGESIPSNAPDIPRAPMNEVVPKCRFSPNADVPHVGVTVFGAFMRRRCAKPPVGRAAQRHAQR